MSAHWITYIIYRLRIFPADCLTGMVAKSVMGVGMGEAIRYRRALKIGDSMQNNGGSDGTRTRGLLRDRQAF